MKDLETLFDNLNGQLKQIFLLSFSNVPLSNLSLSANMFWENAVLGLMDRIDLILF